MIDQATELRKLVLRAMRAQPIATGPPPRLIVLTGGKGGVGVTTIAVNLSVALAEQGSRVVVVDADMHRSDVATLCGLRDYQTGTNLLEASRDIHQMLLPGPNGIQILPRLRVHGLNDHVRSEPGPSREGVGEISFERLRRQFATLGRHADIVILDLGSGSGELIRRFSSAADDVLLVTTPDSVAVMDAYTRIKTDLALATDRSLRLVVNLAADAAQAAEVHRRIDSSSQNFLHTTIAFAGPVPQDEAVSRGATRSIPFVRSEPKSPASQAIERLAAALVASPSQARTA
ncbi:MAG: P-loop NTPase [Planctomycetota bacterium]